MVPLRKCVLIVEDEGALRKIVKRRLESNNYDVFDAASGEDGLNKVYAGGVDLIILDIMLPGIDGYEVCRRLKNNPRYSGIPVLMFTALGGGESQEKAFEAGADDYLVKPYEADTLLYKVKTLLERSSPWH